MPGSGSRSNTSASSDYSEESSDPEASAVSHPGWRAALAERRQQVGEMDEWPQPKAAAKPPGRTQRTAPPPLPKGSSSSTDEVDSEDGENADGRETLRFGLGAPDDDDETDEMEDEERAYAGWGRRPVAPAMTWPPAVAVNSNHPDLIGLGPEPGRKKKKPGIIYLSSIPQGFNVSRTTGFFAQYGRVGRVYLQPDLKEKAQRKDKLARNFTEGWVEFQSKRLAKEVAANLNLSQVGGKKRSKSHDVTWNIKYLTGFKWTHLSEKLAYEKAVHQQRMRNEISQAKRETDFIKTNLEKSKRLEKRKLKDEGGAQPVGGPSPTKRQRVKYEFRQKETDEAIRQAKKSNAAAAKSSVKKKSSSAGKFVVTDVKKEDVEDEDEASPPKRRRSSSGEASTSAKPPPPSKKNPPGKGGKTPGKKPKSPAATNGKPAKKEPPSIKKKVAAEGKGPGKAGKATTANNSAAGGGGKARTPSGGGNRKHQAPQPDRNELLKSLM